MNYLEKYENLTVLHLRSLDTKTLHKVFIFITIKLDMKDKRITLNSRKSRLLVLTKIRCNDRISKQNKTILHIVLRTFTKILPFSLTLDR